MDNLPEKLFMIRHGDYDIDEKTRKQTLALGYEEAAKSTVDALRRRINPKKSIGFISGGEERHILSIRHIASALEAELQTPQITCPCLGGSRSDIACREILKIFKKEQLSQYIICSSSGDISNLGIPCEMLTHFKLGPSRIYNFRYSLNNWKGIYINLKTGNFETIP